MGIFKNFCGNIFLWIKNKSARFLSIKYFSFRFLPIFPLGSYLIYLLLLKPVTFYLVFVVILLTVFRKCSSRCHFCLLSISSQPNSSPTDVCKLRKLVFAFIRYSPFSKLDTDRISANFTISGSFGYQLCAWVIHLRLSFKTSEKLIQYCIMDKVSH